MRVTVVHNSSAGTSSTGVAALIGLIGAAGHRVAYRSTDDHDWHHALDRTGDLVVAAGGDGTVRRVFERLAGTPTLTTVLPLGSANNVARTLGIASGRLTEVIAEWDQAERSHFDLPLFAAETFQRRSVESVGAGIFADLLALDPGGQPASAAEKAALGLRILGQSLGRARPAPWTLELDGRDLSEELVGIEAMNVGTIGPAVPLAPGADPTDGVLEIVLLTPAAVGVLTDYTKRRLSGDDPPPPNLTRHRGRRLALPPPPSAPPPVDDQHETRNVSVNGWTVTADGIGVNILLPAAS